MFLVYTHQITPRVRYVFKHIFTRILQIDISFTNKVEEFVAFTGPKLSYTKIQLGKEFFVKSNDLLFEQGVNDVEIVVSKWEGLPCFFLTNTTSVIPFDVFSASFYLLSRYEEYLPQVKDSHGRFTAKDSIAFKNNFLETPLIDLWAYKFLQLIKVKFPDYKYTKRNYNFISTIDVDSAFKYKSKGMVRTIGGFFKDVWGLKIVNLFDRIFVNLNLKKDPYDTFDKYVFLKKKYDISLIFFFLVADYSSLDTNISTSKLSFKLLIKHMVDYVNVGLQSSYFSSKKDVILKKEKERLESITNMPLIASRQHFLRFTIPDTYKKLIDLEILQDYSMGYDTHVGFRASTCTPFYFYNIDFEIQTPLKVFPFAFKDSTLKYHLKLTHKQAIGKITDLQKTVKSVNGTFITVFHNESISNYGEWSRWQKVYESMLKIVK